MFKSKSKSGVYGREKDRYLELVLQFPLRPIRNQGELDKALSIARTLYDKPESKLSSAESDYLDILDHIIETYEDEHFPMDEGTDGDLLNFLLESNRLTQAQLAKAVGIATSTISEVISGKRMLTRKQIEKLSAYFHVSPAVFHKSK